MNIALILSLSMMLLLLSQLVAVTKQPILMHFRALVVGGISIAISIYVISQIAEFQPLLIPSYQKGIEKYSRASLNTELAGQNQAQESFHIISIESASQLDAPRDNAGLIPGVELTPGTTQLLDIPFDLGWVASTQCIYLPKRPKLMHFPANISSPKFIHILLQGAITHHNSKDREIGRIRLSFSDGQVLDTPLILGSNLRDWAINRYLYTVGEASSSTLREAWPAVIEFEDRWVTGVMDVLTIPIPERYASMKLETISVRDTTEETLHSMDPCIHLLGLTVESGQ